jgi:AcrR family transcriptional regulator
MDKKYNIQDDVRQSLLEAASNIFSHYGYNKTTVDDIAKAARKGKSTFYYYYKSKEEIFQDVIEKEAQIFKLKLIESISIEGNPIEKIKRYILTRLHTFKDLVNFYKAFRHENRDHFNFIERTRGKYDIEQVNIIKMILIEGINKNIIEINDIDLAAESLAVILKGLEYNLLFSLTDVVIEEEKIDKILSMLFYGIVKK